jgi:hypothetical protein
MRENNFFSFSKMTLKVHFLPESRSIKIFRVVDCNPVGLFTNFKFGLLTHGLLTQIGNP